VTTEDRPFKHKPTIAVDGKKVKRAIPLYRGIGRVLISFPLAISP